MSEHQFKDPLTRVKALQKRALEKSRLEQEVLEEVGHELLPVKTQVHETQQPIPESALERAQLNLFNMERAGRFNSCPIHPSNEFPTFLTRVPIFLPNDREAQKKHLDQDNALPFESSWGKGRRHGPNLNTYDEDTLFALAKLRKSILVGPAQHMPVPVSRLFSEAGNDEIHVHTVLCTLDDIENVCGTKRGGQSNKSRLDSIVRLAATRIELDSDTSAKPNVLGKSKGTVIGLLDVHWETFEKDAILFVQFHPIVARWLEAYYTFVDFKIRSKLGPVGKSIHRFLSSQRKNYEITIPKLLKAVNYLGEYKLFMRALRKALKTLESEEWIQAWEISGTGRKIPHKLSIRR